MILSASKVSKHFGGIKALNKATLLIKKPGVYALIGPNGSGKTTLFNVITGFEQMDSGKVRVDGAKNNTPTHKLGKKYLSRTFQQPQLFDSLTIADHIEIALNQKDEKMLPMMMRSLSTDKKRAREALEVVGLEKPLDTPAGDLSYGQKKLLEIAVAVAKPHKLLLFDEPVAGVNPKLRKQLEEVIEKLSEKGETILFIEHDMNFVMNVADHVFVLDDGRIIKEGTPEEVREDPAVLEAYLGE